MHSNIITTHWLASISYANPSPIVALACQLPAIAHQCVSGAILWSRSVFFSVCRSDDSFCEAASFSGETSMAPPPSKLHPATTMLMRLVTEDTPPDMLAGSMDLRVTLPNGKTSKMSVERRSVCQKNCLPRWQVDFLTIPGSGFAIATFGTN